MAQPVNGTKELNLNKPEAFDGNRDGFKKFLQNVEVYMDVNHKTYNNDLRKIVFVLSFMATGSAATWKTQFIEEAYTRPAPPTPMTDLGLTPNSGRISWRRSPCSTLLRMHWTSYGV
jgi:Domain of unknown function (DUF4939)